MALNNIARRMTHTSVEDSNVNTGPPDLNLDEKRSVDAGDVEAGGSRRMSRIDKKDVNPSDTDSTISIGAQIELEKGNAIQYRTCSWQKVRSAVS
jgi:hypothetical protein